MAHRPHTGLTTSQLERKLADVPHFAGVFAANQLPLVHHLPPHSSLIANYSPSSSGGSHWVAIGNLNVHGEEPWYFDPFGFNAGDLNSLLHTHASFEAYMKTAARVAGVGHYRTNKIELQCSTSDACGYFSMFAIRHGLPAEDNGRVRRPWRKVLRKPATCEAVESRLRKHT